MPTGDWDLSLVPWTGRGRIVEMTDGFIAKGTQIPRGYQGE